MTNAKEIQAEIHRSVSNWKPRIWSWPHDSFMHHPWGYAIHEASVDAWNKEGRKTDCVTFLLDWATTENIEAAVSKYGLSDSSHFKWEYGSPKQEAPERS